MAESLPSPVSAPTRESVQIPPHFSSSTPLTDNLLLCSICKNFFNDPVSTACGHNFCKTCLTQHWDKNECCQCPMCDKAFEDRPDLKVNDLVTIMIAKFRELGKAEIPARPREVQCDICVGKKMKAVKSCIDCYSRLCETHVLYHSNLPQFGAHKLIDDVDNIDIYVCQRHRKRVELFCRDDHMCVCQFCTEGDHKTHNTVPIKEESTEKKAYLKTVQAEVQQSIEDREKKIQEVQKSAELIKRNTEKEISDSAEIFTALIRSIERGQSELLEEMEEKQKAAEKQAEELIKELEQEITELKRRDTELEQLLNTEDHLHLLQIYPSQCSRPRTRTWANIIIAPFLSIETPRNALSELYKTLNENLYKKELKKIRQFKVNVTLDPKTAHASLILSQDRKQVRKGTRRMGLAGSQRGFHPNTGVLGKPGFSSGRFYYEVQVNGKSSWTIGVTKVSIISNSVSTLDPAAGFWALTQKENEFHACSDPPVLLSLKEKLQKLGVFVDCEDGLVSFYDVEARSHIYSFTDQSFSGELYPYFNPIEGGKNSTPLIITPIS